GIIGTTILRSYSLAVALRITTETGARRLERVALSLGQLRILEVEALQRVHDDFGNRYTREPFVIGGNDEPRRVFGARRRQRILVCGHVVVPALALVEVGRLKLPVLGGLVEPRQQTPPLLLFRHVEEELEH